MKKTFFIILLSFVLLNSFYAQTKTETQNIFAKSYDYVNDFEKILTQKQIEDLKRILKSGETKSNLKILIITTPAIEPYTDLSEYASDLDKYLVDNLKINASILIIISKKMRQIQVQAYNKLLNKTTGKEIEMENIVATFIIPELKKDDYNKGLQQGVLQIFKNLE
ncbi:YgcG family protein [Flavobacterium sp. W22_SRS_FK3]|uniref:TPM domain-containing protein n=1 Tax=Flavobacterium sp. W22_SRS_FK3 TaxID=3240275 RepID=UPI003F8FE5A8